MMRLILDLEVVITSAFICWILATENKNLLPVDLFLPCFCVSLFHSILCNSARDQFSYSARGAF